MVLRLDQPFADLLQKTFLRLVGRPLIDGGPTGAVVLYNEMAAPLLAHDTSDDPRIVYANKAAQACFGYAAAEFAGLPLRLSAETGSQEAQQALLDEVARAGFVRGYSGVGSPSRGENSASRTRSCVTSLMVPVSDAARPRPSQSAPICRIKAKGFFRLRR